MLYFPPEWHPRQGAVMVAWPHMESDWAYMLDDVLDCYERIVSALSYCMQVLIVTPAKHLVASHLGHLSSEQLHNIVVFEVPTNDTWTRDYGPLTVFYTDASGKTLPLIYDFKFNGWGLKFAANKDNVVNTALDQAGAFRYFCPGVHYINRLNFVLEGGSIESDGASTLMTTSQCLLSPNRNGHFSKAEIENYLKATFGASQVLWVDYGALAGDDTDSHIDTLARFAPGNTILYCGCDNPDDEHYEGLKAMEQQLAGFRNTHGKPYNLLKLPLPDAIYDEDGLRLPATYANFLITPQAVLMPTYGQERNDLLAMQILQVAFENHMIKPIDCRALIRQHGSLHCATMQIPTL